MATHLAMDVYLTLGIQNAIFYTFGSPRVGNQAFAQFVDSYYPNACRVVHYQDIVPHAPLISMNYWHIATEIFYQETCCDYVTCNSSGEDPSCSD